MRIENLKIVSSAKNVCYRPACDGLYVRNKKYFISFCHGGDEGEIALEMNDSMIDVTPDKFRDAISDFLDIRIEKENPIFIFPCYPGLVIKRYKEELRNNNIWVLGNWESTTYWTPFKNGKMIKSFRDFPTDNDEISFSFRGTRDENYE